VYRPETVVQKKVPPPEPIRRKIIDITERSNIVLLPLPLSGANGEIGNGILNACLLAAAERDNGPINFWVIDASNPNLDIYKLHEKFKRADLKAILGPVFFKEAMQLGAIFPATPIFTLSNNRSVNNSHIFACGVSPVDEIKALCAYADSHGLHDLLVLLPETALGNQLSEQITDETNLRGFNNYGDVEVMRYRSMSEEDAAKYIKNSGKKAVFMIDPLVTPSELDGVAVFTLASVALSDREDWEGAFYAFFSSPTLANFIGKYRNLFGKDPGPLEIIAYDLVNFLQDLTTAGMSEDNLYEKYSGCSGFFSMKKNGGLKRRLSVVQLKEASS
jgi:hypothetical protein